MSFHWHPHNKGICKAALMFSGKLYSSVVPNQPIAADFISLVTNLQRELNNATHCIFSEMLSSTEIALSWFLIKNLSIIAGLSKCNYVQLYHISLNNSWAVYFYNVYLFIHNFTEMVFKQTQTAYVTNKTLSCCEHWFSLPTCLYTIKNT